MTWKFKDLREYISFLENKGDLRRITTPVSTDLEITEITDRMVKQGGPALLFDHVEGNSMPVLINMFGTTQRSAWALGIRVPGFVSGAPRCTTMFPCSATA